MTKRRLTVVDMVEEFQCSGCGVGSDTKCGSYKLDESYGAKCSSHVPGTNLLGKGRIALGLPKGFNRYGLYGKQGAALHEAVDGHMTIRLWPDEGPPYDKFNVPVWRMYRDGMTFLRVMSPRTNASFVDVIQGREAFDKLDRVIDAGQFYDDMD